MLDWRPGEIRAVPLEELGESYRRYRLPDAPAEMAMTPSLLRYGQMAPIVVCLRQDRPEVLDGFKRLLAARQLATTKTLNARLLAADERAAKVAIYGLNQAGRHTRELEEAWIVSALVQEDHLSQVEVAELLGRHKSWVCRRLALLERWWSTATRTTRRCTTRASWRSPATTASGQSPVCRGGRRPRARWSGRSTTSRPTCSTADRSTRWRSSTR
jgi:hypothetical protein